MSGFWGGSIWTCWILREFTSYFFILDMGMSATINQELAKVNITENDRRYKIDLLKTLEWVYWGLAIFIFIIIVLIQSFFQKPGDQMPVFLRIKLVNAFILWAVCLYFGFRLVYIQALLMECKNNIN